MTRSVIRNKRKRRGSKRRGSKRRSSKRGIQKKIIRDGTAPDDDKVVIRFFEKLMITPEFIVDTPISTETKAVFKEFFDAFNRTDVKINENDIVMNQYSTTDKNINYIDKGIREYIQKNMVKTYTYDTYIDRPVKISILFLQEEEKGNVARYIKMMVSWLKVVSSYAQEPCTQKLNITIFLTDLKKVLLGTKCSSHSSCIIGRKQVNTGYSTRCDEIVIFREEEWFKVFVHETIHNLALDFYVEYDPNVETKVKTFFGMKRPFEMKLFEAYTEAWARILNCLQLSYDEEKTNFERFVVIADRNILLERLNGFFQTNKILKYQHLDIDNLSKYIEEPANFSYYLLVAILYSDYQDFFKWCRENNTNILQFDNTKSSNKQNGFVDFIISKAEKDSTFRKNYNLFQKKFFQKDEEDYLYRYMKKSILTRSLVV